MKCLMALFFAAAAVFFFTACSGKVLRPDDPTANGGMNESCSAVSPSGEPLVIDWPAQERGDLEESMHDGIAVVHYDCQSLRLLRGCHVEGDYGFMAFSKKEEVVELTSNADIRINLPSYGSAFLKDLGGSLERGTTLDLAMVLVGKRRTTMQRATRRALVGEAACEGATHIVKGAFVGAFAMGTGSQGAVMTSAGIFGSAGAKSSRIASHRDGDRETCGQVALGAETPPSTCGALVRLELRPLVDSAPDERPTSKPKPEPPPDLADNPTCPEGFEWSGTKCTKPASGKVCSRADIPTCLTECRAGSAAGCEMVANQALANALSGRPNAVDVTFAAKTFTQNCEAGDAQACNQRGYMLSHGVGAPVDGVQSATFYERACAMGNEASCGNLGYLYDTGVGVPRDANRAIALYKRACNGGRATACANLGIKLDQDMHDARDAFVYYQRGCAGDAGIGCEGVALLLLAKDPARAAIAGARACELGEGAGCTLRGRLSLYGKGVPKDVKEAIGFFAKACDGGYAPGCDLLGNLAYDGKEVPKDLVTAARLFDKGCQGTPPTANSCNELGLLVLNGNAGASDPAKAAALFDRACKLEPKTGGSGGCGNLGESFERGRGVPRDLKSALQLYGVACRAGDAWGCDQERRLQRSR